MPDFKSFIAAQKKANQIHSEYGFKASVFEVTKPNGIKLYHVISPRLAGMKKLSKRRK